MMKTRGVLSVLLFPSLWSISLKQKCCYFDEIFITGCTGSCHFDNFRCSQWWKFCQNDNIFVSVLPAMLSLVPSVTNVKADVDKNIWRHILTIWVNQWWKILIMAGQCFSLWKKTLHLYRIHKPTSCKHKTAPRVDWSMADVNAK